ncbi:EAL domain-containing protein [Alkalilimnicola sp. S0819]|uniref:EAL domain-containing protein n=1 Tax=Alkalilimnicola sp. S0819 TaxID=2613922 RepID=UPI001261BF6D|nr:EAL domain-containing protein [Alkalilimnicola sp. S0819]KAB7623136.1 REC domain-containing phosphodiesterase [Alkalilimnicola sp. S0819]MPQ16980.1 EAL domain-containing protein [Alkalilimnicola sp. S0819]
MGDQSGPIYLLFQDGTVGEALALDLRHYGYKARHFVSAAVMGNAAATLPPAAVIAELEALGEEPLAAPQAPHIFVSRQDDMSTRLRAIRANGSGFFHWPLNRTALLHRLSQLLAADSAEQPTALLLEEPGSCAPVERDKLEAAGIRLLDCDTSDQLLETLRREAVDLLLLHADETPECSLELVQALRQIPSYQGLPVILLTSADKRSLDDAAIVAGVDSLLGLPVAATDLAAIIHHRVGRARDLRSAWRYLARREPLTGLYNDEHFYETLRHTLAARRAGTNAALALLRLEGDQAQLPGLLVEAAEQLHRLLPPASLAARLSDGDIGLLLHGLDASALEQLASEIDSQMSKLPASARLGMTVVSAADADPGQLLDRATQALQLAGGEAGDQAVRSEADQALLEQWHKRVSQALVRQHFRLVYQPVASLSGQPSSFYEVFLRLRSEDGDDILPREFLPAVARAGLEPQLDRWVLSRAAEVLGSQRETAPVLFVKLFAESISNPDIAKHIAQCVRENAVRPEQLVLQIPESTAITRLSESARLVRALRDLGCGVALEHVSDGNQSLELLQTLKPDYIKLAGNLTRAAATDVQQQKRIQTLVAQARSTGARTIAPLVQDAGNLSVLWQCGVEYIQGYFMQEPADVFASEALSS